jgi:hypothetical protein
MFTSCEFRHRKLRLPRDYRRYRPSIFHFFFFGFRYWSYLKLSGLVVATIIAVRASSSSGPHSLVFRSAPTGNACSLSAAKLGQSSSMWAGVWTSVQHWHSAVSTTPMGTETTVSSSSEAIYDGGLSIFHENGEKTRMCFMLPYREDSHFSAVMEVA